MLENSIEATEAHVFEGSLRKIVIDLDISLDYYQQARNLLGEMGCIRYLRTGRGNNPSLIQLIRRPSIETYNEYREMNKGGHGKRKGAGSEIIMGRINDLVRRMDALEADMRTTMGLVRESLKVSNSNDDQT